MEAAFLFLTQQQIRYGAQQNRLGVDARPLCFIELVDHLVAEQGELLVGGKLWHDVVVIGIEPLGHLHRSDIIAILLIAPCHGEQQYRYAAIAFPA